MPEGGWNPKATLDQVTDAKHPNEAFNTIRDAIISIVFTAPMPWAMFAHFVHELFC